MQRAYPNRPLVGVGAVVWRGDKVLLVKRGRPPNLERWSLPGGAQEVGETIVEAARREVIEETGLAITQVRFLTALDMIERDELGHVRYHYTLVDVVARAEEGRAVAGGDANGAEWFTLDQLPPLMLWSETTRVIALAAELIGVQPPLAE